MTVISGRKLNEGHIRAKLNVSLSQENCTAMFCPTPDLNKEGPFDNLGPSPIFFPSQFYNCIIPLLGNLGLPFLAKTIEHSSRKSSATHPNQVSVIYLSTYPIVV